MDELEKESSNSEQDPNNLIDHRYVFLSGHLANLQVPLPSFIDLQNAGLINEEEVKKLELALDEALANAIDHGNLELDSSLREEFDEQGRDRFSLLREERLSDNRFASRFVFVQVSANSQQLQVSVRDEGKGFDTSTKQTQIIETDQNLPNCSGRGLILIRAASDEIRFNQQGNELVFTKKLKVLNK